MQIIDSPKKAAADFSLTGTPLFYAYCRLVKFERVKIPETVDAVGVQPTASKLFGSFGRGEHFGCPSV